MSLPDISQYIMPVSRIVLPFFALWVLLRCLRSMLRDKYEPEIWAYLIDAQGEHLPLHHWECVVGRAASSDLVVDDPAVSRVHASLMRDDTGAWTVSDIKSKSGTRLNGKPVYEDEPLKDGDKLSFAGSQYTFRDTDEARRAALQRQRTAPGRFIGPGVTLLILTIFQAILALEFTVTAARENVLMISMAFLALMVTEWFCYLVMRSIRRTGFEPETLAFFLSTLGTAVAASSTPDEMLKQIILLLAGIVLFFFLGWWLRDLRRVKAVRWVATFGAMGLLALNLAFSEAVFGARNWFVIGGISIQPSELVKVVYIFAGAAGLDRLFQRRNLLGFIVFSAVCVCALALMGDFGTAVIFFATFLVISFMRSGSFATVLLAVTGAGLAGFLVLSARPYIAARFATWGHAWEDVWDGGYQQTQTMSAAASGGLFGRGAGEGGLKAIFAADTDMVFGMLSEELGLIIGLCAIFALIALAFFTVRNAAHGRSTYYVIAGCAAISLMLVQMSLNVFGSLDILPFTGVTFPFVSKGGTSLISCWMLLSFIKATDTRRDASFVVKPAARARVKPSEEAED